MAAKFFILVSLAVAASALPVVPLAQVAYAEPEAPAHYEFQYSVHDEHSGDIKQQHEARAGDALQGSYSLVQPDGVHRVVDYTADKEHGFNAIVRYEGHPTAAPAKIAYASAPVAYAAPKFAYAPRRQGCLRRPRSQGRLLLSSHPSYLLLSGHLLPPLDCRIMLYIIVKVDLFIGTM
ncbi:unnamed protein product [Parnassius apollo]|uniref:(apollo) hypothetical protein n=1 Tax=Parnassius apollo TaxID=110799 RepID=A0A8S3W669_PARAO|nr:unnamed protein product [Parnassius apollo]